MKLGVVLFQLLGQFSSKENQEKLEAEHIGFNNDLPKHLTIRQIAVTKRKAIIT